MTPKKDKDRAPGQQVSAFPAPFDHATLIEAARQREQRAGSAVPTVAEAQGRLAEVERQLNAAFPERRQAIRGALVAAVGSEHLMLFGPPGTAKSAMARALADALCGGSYFEILMTKFTAPEELYGPISFAGLKQDRYERLLDGFAVRAEVVFVDEVWKSSSAILNSLLTLTNERVFHNGGKPVPADLRMLIGASNEYPQDESLAALYDRLALRYWVDYIGDEDQMRALLARGGVSPITARLLPGDLDVLRGWAEAMPLTDADIGVLLAVKAAATAAGFAASDRTWVKAARLIRAAAVVRGAPSVGTGDYMILADMLWKEAKDRPALRQVVGNAADPYGSRAEAIVDAVKAAMAGLPDLSLLKTGMKTKVEMTKVIAQVSGQVAAERDKVLALVDEAPGSAASLSEAKDLVEAALAQVDALAREVTWYRERKAT